MSIEIIGLRFTHRKSINPSLYGPFFNYFGGGILRYYLQVCVGKFALEGHVRLDGPKFFLYRIQGTHQQIHLLGVVISLYSFHTSS